MTLSVIFTTYNSPEWLEKVLWGYHSQTFKNFEVLVADDGSSEATFLVVKRMQAMVHFPLKHIWHEDKGFRKCKILNKAILEADSDYLVFSDGDCIPRADFLQTHFDSRKENYFLSGGAIRLPMKLSKLISRDHIMSQKAFDKDWLNQNGLPLSRLESKKLGKIGTMTHIMNTLTPTKATWNGGNASAWKKDVVSVNGFDERMRYGSEDREFGERLMNNGIKGIQVRYSAICLHLDHSRSYKNQKDIDFNKKVRRNTKLSRSTWTEYGISKK